MAAYEYDDFWVEFSPRAGGGYSVAARAPDGETSKASFQLPFTNEQLEAAVRTLGYTRAATTRDIGEVTTERRLTAEQLGGELADSLLIGPTGDLYNAGAIGCDRQGPRRPPVAVARQGARAVERPVGVPVPPADVPRQPAEDADRAVPEHRCAGRAPPDRGHRADPRCGRQPRRPAEARGRAGAQACRRCARQSPPGSRGDHRLARPGHAQGAPARAPEGRISHPPLRRSQRLRRRERRRARRRGWWCALPRERGSQRRAGLRCPAGQPARRPGFAASRRPQLV